MPTEPSIRAPVSFACRQGSEKPGIMDRLAIYPGIGKAPDLSDRHYGKLRAMRS